MRSALLLRRHVACAHRRAYAARTVPLQPFRAKPKPVLKPEPIDKDFPVGEVTLTDESPAKPPSSFAPWVFGVLAAGLGFYSFQIGLAVSQPCSNPHVAELAQQKDVAARYDYTADSFDSEVGLSELLMGINSTRKLLAQKCRGEVLEVSCGTGRNLGYYDINGEKAKVDSLSFIDLSPQMVDVCRQKWNTLYGSQETKRDKLKPGLNLRFMTGSALSDMPLAPSGKKYDTIFQTMGLCSTAEPAELLENLVKHLDTSKQESRILLLEHGRSYMPWVNRILDNSAEKHAERHGCWFNRDIGDLVQQAAQKSGMEVVSERRHHFGTTWVFELKPTDELVRRAAAVPTILAATRESAHEPKGSGWLSKLGWT